MIMLKKVVIGLLAGIISGFFSSGGGLILVPAFVHILKMDDKMARATSVFLYFFYNIRFFRSYFSLFTNSIIASIK